MLVMFALPLDSRGVDRAEDLRFKYSNSQPHLVIYVYTYIYVYIYIYLVGGLEHFLFFHNICDNPSHWLIFFRGVETTNQIYIYHPQNMASKMMFPWYFPGNFVDCFGPTRLCNVELARDPILSPGFLLRYKPFPVMAGLWHCFSRIIGILGI